MGIRAWGLVLFGMLLLVNEMSLGETSPITQKDKIAIARSRCSLRVPDEQYFFMDMFKAKSSQKELDESYKTVYNQEERLFNRAYFDKNSNSFVTTDGKDLSVSLPDTYIESVILHIEKALKLNYAKHVFFPDMGHSHLQIPLDYFNIHHKGAPSPKNPLLLNEYLKAPGLKSLYHTAEKLLLTKEGKIIDDWYSQWRFFTRNLLADSAGNIEILTNKESVQNTVSSISGYKWSIGLSFSANKNGCFPFKDKAGSIQYFDISAWDPPYDCVNNFCEF